jgi:hypothetical protein
LMRQAWRLCNSHMHGLLLGMAGVQQQSRWVVTAAAKSCAPTCALFLLILPHGAHQTDLASGVPLRLPAVQASGRRPRPRPRPACLDPGGACPAADRQRQQRSHTPGGLPWPAAAAVHKPRRRRRLSSEQQLLKVAANASASVPQHPP